MAQQVTNKIILSKGATAKYTPDTNPEMCGIVDGCSKQVRKGNKFMKFNQDNLNEITECNL